MHIPVSGYISSVKILRKPRLVRVLGRSEIPFRDEMTTMTEQEAVHVSITDILKLLMETQWRQVEQKQ